ncbi:hypothetical protein B6U80_02140 [Candidatus Pacearchaeota archaeon ex4484_26]|nr:MAG: hypothetical protein B6U80_02140 [Candidatus Pacearchaeota archaeon ex4484_26]RLF37133.1 MAG: hypothetical protein DRM99_01205 [Thermoplasmata archaeon]
MVLEFLIQYWYGYGFLDFRNVLDMWRSAGLFDVVLPFILIFAIVFAVLEKSRILGQNKAVHAIISLVLGFFAVSIPWFNNFFAVLFSNAALGFSILLVVVLFLGFFITENQQVWWKWVGGIFAVGVFFWVLSRSLQQAQLTESIYFWFSHNPAIGSALLYGLVIIIILAAVIFAPTWTRSGEKYELTKAR